MSAETLRQAAQNAREAVAGEGWAVLLIAASFDEDADNWDDLSEADRALAVDAAATFLPGDDR